MPSNKRTAAAIMRKPLSNVRNTKACRGATSTNTRNEATAATKMSKLTLLAP
jgi:hypothetical protein